MGSKNAPGTYSGNNVRCTMDAPFGKAASAGHASGGRNMATPFDKAPAVGKNDLSLRLYVDLPATAAKTQNAAMGGLRGINRTNPVGTRRFKQPK